MGRTTLSQGLYTRWSADQIFTKIITVENYTNEVATKEVYGWERGATRTRVTVLKSFTKPLV